MMEEAVFEYATTDDPLREKILLAAIVLFFLVVYDEEQASFASKNDVNIDFESTIKFSYEAYITDLLIGLRNRVQAKAFELSETEQAEADAALLLLVQQNYERLYLTESGNITQTAQLEIVQYLQQTNSNVVIYKRWVSALTSDTCEICQALHGTTVLLDEPFLANGQIVSLASGKEFIYNYIDRDVCIAHPNDRCHIEFIIDYENGKG